MNDYYCDKLSEIIDSEYVLSEASLKLDHPDLELV